MASSTPNLDLTLPVGGENVSRQIINANNVKIDEAVGAVPSGTNLQSQVTALNNKLREKDTVLSASNVTTDLFVLSLDPGDYQVSGTKSQYLPTRYGTLSKFKSAGNYGYVLVKATDGSAWVRHFTSGEWHEDWRELALKSDFTTPEDKKITRVGSYFTERDAFKARRVGNTIGIYSYVNITTQVPSGTTFADIGFASAEGVFLFYSSTSIQGIVNCSGGKLKPDANLATGYYYAVGSALTPI